MIGMAFCKVSPAVIAAMDVLLLTLTTCSRQTWTQLLVCRILLGLLEAG